MMKKSVDPKTPSEWQSAVDAAHALPCLASAKLYGLVVGVPKINCDRCEDILKLGLRRGYKPRRNAVEKLLEELRDG